MYNIKLAVWIFLITVIDTVFIRYIGIGNIMPDLIFIFVISFALTHKNALSVMTIAAICGVLGDCMSGRIFGNYTAVYLICSVLVFILHDCIYSSNFFIDIALVFIISLLGKSLFYLINISILKEMGYLYAFLNIILPETVYNTVLSCIMLPAVKHFFKRKAGTFK